jgi:uncharacterized membrane protein (UPF0182 family)
LIRVAMMYNDKIGYGPTVSDALTGLFGPGASAAATDIAPTESGAAAQGTPPSATPPVAAVPAPPSAEAGLSPAKAAALREIEAALTAVRDTQHRGDFAAYGAALQRLDDAMAKFNSAK